MKCGRNRKTPVPSISNWKVSIRFRKALMRKGGNSIEKMAAMVKKSDCPPLCFYPIIVYGTAELFNSLGGCG